MIIRRILSLTCASVVALAGAMPVHAQSYGVRQTVPAGSAPRMVNLPRGTSFAVDLPADARDVIVSNPAVAEANVHSPRRITVIGIAPGETDAVFMDAAGRSILTLRVRVDAGVSALQDTLSRVVPGADVRAEAVNDSIILTGLVTSPAEADRVVQIARAFVSEPEKVLNMLSVAGSDQVTLKVRVVEVQRNAIKQLGLSTNVVYNDGNAAIGFGRGNTWGANGAYQGSAGLCYGEQNARTTNFSEQVNSGLTTTDGLTATSGSTTNLNTTTQVGVNGVPGTYSLNTTGVTTALENTVGGTLTNAITGLASTIYSTITGTNTSNCLEAFERVGLVRTLAEPNLTAVNGESATFLAGGEFPVPVGRDRDGTVTVEYKPYGVSVAFRPVVLSGGNISMQISLEVSELSAGGGLTIGAGTVSAISLPGLSVRRSGTTVELPSGGSLMIAGLLAENTRQTIDSLPGATNLPVLGSLFRSRDYLSGETELVMIVEPWIVRPTRPGQMQTPADGLRIATDAQTIFFGQLNQTYGSPAPTTSASAGWQGPVGYVIE
ncbi:MAG: type II and III secretion system protein family protein [Brevundimonas sp.]|uniref:type II and III secretion system protein family protein n=1 Tax=Brevundimonas sp. TaxID=1871086 RepID=UPI002735A8B4|nr:type II and III secretion system protein family protein [Brevundimonas sp.]MDP3405151.1 type II and III secretion system protein family protein [Brevundimonas sp.]